MNISQDDVNALLSGENSATDSGDDSVDIMTPEMIAAMLDEAAVLTDDDSTDGGGSDALSPDDISAMLSAAENGAAPSEAEAMLSSEPDNAGDALRPEDIAAMLDAASESPEPAPVPAAAEQAEESGVAAPFGDDHIIEGMLTDQEVDILGEVGNISMGAVATTMYSLLDRRVSITTPRVHVFNAKEVLSIYNLPFVVATIEYVDGITGNNLLVLRIEDAALITDLLMGGDGTLEEPIELNELHLSAMSEIMNQMMGASSTSLSKILHKPINISPPQSAKVDIGFDVTTLLGDIDMVTKISFDMEIEGLLKSELIQLVPYEESREFAKLFIDAGSVNIPTGKEAASTAPPPAAAPPPQPMPAAAPPPAAAAPPPAPPPPPMAAPQPPPVQQAPIPPQDPYQQMPYPGAPYPQQIPHPQAPYPPHAAPAASAGRLVDVHPMQFQSFDATASPTDQKGIDLVYNIPLQVTVELGKTKKEINEILTFSAGTVVVLDKIAGDPVEIVVNGKLIARGEVVVIDENYGVRITDIINL